MVDEWQVTICRADGGTAVTHELNVLALFKGSERFIFVYDDESRDELIDTIRHSAADPRTAINWFDAGVLTERARQQGKEPQHTTSRL
jgi:hypothetical protein